MASSEIFIGSGLTKVHASFRCTIWISDTENDKRDCIIKLSELDGKKPTNMFPLPVPKSRHSPSGRIMRVSEDAEMNHQRERNVIVVRAQTGGCRFPDETTFTA